jgi:hypothetical protein
MPSSTTKPDLDKLYREAGLRNSHTRHGGLEVSAFDSFYSFGDFKRELRAILIVPFIGVREVIKQVLHAFFELLTAGVQLVTFDSRFFGSLYNVFVHIGNAIALTFEGLWGTIGSALSLYFRANQTLAEAIVGLIFDNEPTDSEYIAEDHNVVTFSRQNPLVAADTALRFNVEPSAPMVVAAASLYPTLPTVHSETDSIPYSGRNGMFAQPTAPVARPSLMQAVADLERLGLTEDEVDTLFQNMIQSNDYTDDRRSGFGPQ